MPNPLSRGWSASLALVTVVATAAGVVAACGGGGTKAGATPTSSGATAAAYIACLTAHGYTPPANVIQRIEHPPTTDANGDAGGFGGGGFGGGGFGGGGGTGGGAPGATDAGGTTRSTLDPATQAARQAAFAACQSQAPAGVRVPGAGGGAFGGQFLNSLRVYISCLDDHGYTAVTTPPTTVANQLPPTGQSQGLRSTLQKIQSDPAAASARQACASIAPTFPGRVTTTTSTTV